MTRRSRSGVVGATVILVPRMLGRSQWGTAHLAAGLVVLGIYGAVFAPVAADARR